MNQTNEMTKIKKSVITAMLIATCVVLPMAFHAIPGAGPILLPMHIPVMLAGLVAGPIFGFITGLTGPFISATLTGMPPAPIMPSMMVELSVYGLVSGLMMKFVHTGRSSFDLYISLVTAMICGRVMAGIAQALVLFDGTYALSIWISVHFVTSMAGIIVQLAFVPSLFMALERERIIPLRYPIMSSVHVRSSSVTV